jgi:hypothetical protein
MFHNKSLLFILLVAVMTLSAGCIFDHRTTPLGPPSVVDGPMVSDCDTMNKWSVVPESLGILSTGTNFPVSGVVGNAVKCVYNLGPQGNCYLTSGVGENWYVWRTNDLRLDAQGYDGVSFYLKGDGKKMDFHVCTIGSFSGTSNSVGSNPLEYNWDFYVYTINITPSQWTRYDIPFSDLRRVTTQSWVTFRQDHITRIEFQAASRVSGEHGTFTVDEVRLYKLAQ